MGITLSYAEPIDVNSQQSAQDWKNAQDTYKAGKLEDSLRLFMQNPSGDASYYYNLGTINFKLGHYGLAVAYLEKANRQRPHDPDIQFNLNLAKGSLGQAIGTDHLDPASTWVEAAADRVPLDEIRGIIGLMGFILAVFWSQRYLKTRRLDETLLRPAGLISLFALLMMVGVYSAQRLAQSHPPAVSLDSLIIRSGPGDQYLELSRAQPGMKLRVLGPVANSSNSKDEVWRQIRYTPEEVGWVRASSLLLL